MRKILKSVNRYMKNKKYKLKGNRDQRVGKEN
jgi:hypothetical protein